MNQFVPGSELKQKNKEITSHFTLFFCVLLNAKCWLVDYDVHTVYKI